MATRWLATILAGMLAAALWAGCAHAPPPGPEPRFAWPVEGELSSGFGARRGGSHEGLDLRAPPGTPIRAAAEGRVIESRRLGAYGNLVVVRHAGSYTSVYAHNRRNLVERGDFVERGERIAEVGNTGNASGPHLHFEIRRNRVPVDPLLYLPRGRELARDP